MEKRITDSHGQTIAYYQHRKGDEVVVRDKHHRYLGRATDRGTYDEHGQRISSAQVPGMLVPDSDE